MDVDQPGEAFQQYRQDEALYDSYDDDGGDDIRSPRRQVEDESNMSALDLYTDMVIRDSEEAALSMAKLKEEKESFKGQLDVALLKVSTLSKENETLTKENQVLRSNISVLLKTAQMELQRKERELNELREMQLEGIRPVGNALSPRKRKTRRAPTHHRQPALLRQNGARHPKNAKEVSATKDIDRRTGCSDSDEEQKPDTRETVFVRRQRDKNQQHSAGATSQPSRISLLSSNEPDSDGRKKSVNEALMRLSQQSSLQIETLHPETRDKEKVRPLMKDADGSDIQGNIKPHSEDVLRHSEPKDSRTQKPEDVEAPVQSLEKLRGKTEEKYHLKERSRSKSVERAIRSTSREKSDIKRSDDRSKHILQKVITRSHSPEVSSKSYSHAKRSSPNRTSRSRSNDKRSSRSKSHDRKSSQSRSSRSKSHERSSRSKSRDRALHGKSYDKSQSSKQRKEEIPRRDSSCATRSELDRKRSKSTRDTLLKQAESLAFGRSRVAGGAFAEKHPSKERHRERDRRDRRDSRRSSTPIRDSIRKDSKEDPKVLSRLKMDPSRERDSRLLERSQSRARERMSSMAKESVAKAKARLNKCTSPKKSHRLEKERRRSSKNLCLDGLTDWTKAEGSLKRTSTGEGRIDVKEDDLTSRRKQERRHESKERKRKHRLSSSFQKESRLSKKRRDGSGSDDTGKVNIPEENLRESSSINPVTYEEGHTVLACGKKDSIECTSSKVTVLHVSASDAYDTTQSEMSFLYLSGSQSDHGVQKQPSTDAGASLNKDIREEGELSEGEIVSDEEETKRLGIAMHGSSEEKQKPSSKHQRGDHPSKRKHRNKETSKLTRRGKKHKRRSSSDQEAGETRKRLKENEKADDSRLSEAGEASSARENKVCKDDIAGPVFSKNAIPPLSESNEPEFQPKSSVSNLDKEKDTLVSVERRAHDHLARNNDAEGFAMTLMSESPVDSHADVENVAKTETSKSHVGEVEDNGVSTLHDESESDSIIRPEDAVENDTVCTNLRIEASPKKAIPSPLKESAFAVGLETRLEVPEGDASVSRGILFEDLCLSSSVDDTSYLSCNEANSENQKQSFKNSIKKVDDLIRDIQDPLVNPLAFDMGEQRKPLELKKFDTRTNLETTTFDPHQVTLKTVTSDSLDVPSLQRQVPSELPMKGVISDDIVDDGTQPKIGQKQQAISSSLADASVELNTNKASELRQGSTVNSGVEDVLVGNDDKSEFANHDADENNDAVSLLAASGDLDSFMQDIAPKTRRVLELSLNESKSIVKEAEAFDKTESSLQLTCEWSNIEFQDSSTKMDAEPDPGTVTIATPIFDDGCARDMNYAKDPLGLDTSVLNGEEHEEQNVTAGADKEKDICVSGTVKDDIRTKEETQTDLLNEPLKDLTNEEHHVTLNKAGEEELSPSRVKGYEKENEEEKLGEGILLQESTNREEGHISCDPIVISDEDRVESELDFEEEEEEEEEEEKEEEKEEEEEEEEEESVYIVDVQYADVANKGADQRDESHVDSEEEEELNLSDQAPDAESEQNALKTLEDVNDPSPVEESKGEEETISGKGHFESEVESELDWESEPEDQNEIVGQTKVGIESEDNDELTSGTAGKTRDTEIGKGNVEDDSEEEGEIVEDEEGNEEEHARDPDEERDRKKRSGKSRTDQRQKRDHSGHSHSHHHHHHRSSHRDSCRGTRDRSSDSHRLDTERKGERGRSGSSDRRLHREGLERGGRNHPLKEDKERSGKGHSDKESSRKLNEQRRDASERRRQEERRRDDERRREEERRRVEDRRREDDRKKAAFLEKKREENRREVERREAEEKKARRLEDERKKHEERKRAPRRAENEKVRSRSHDSEKKREPARKSKKVSEGRKS